MNDDKPKPAAKPAEPSGQPDVTDIRKKKPEDLTPDELRLLADTMPGEGPGDD